MQNLFGIDNNDPFFQPNPQAILCQNEFIIRLQELVLFAPATGEMIKRIFEIPKGQHISIKNMQNIYVSLKSSHFDSTPKSIAKLALQICKPYKYFPIENDVKYNPDIDNPYSALDEYIDYELFEKNNIDSASSDYLLIQYAYIKSLKSTPCNLTDILKNFPKRIPDSILDKIANNYTNLKREVFINGKILKDSVINGKEQSKENTEDNLKFGSDEYIYADLNPSMAVIKRNTELNYSSIYDFIVCHGILTTKDRYNPFLHNEPPLFSACVSTSKKFKPSDMNAFLSHFFPNISFKDQGILFNVIVNYIVERITNINFINKVFVAYKKLLSVHSKWWKDVPFPIQIMFFADYPLPSFRARLMQSIYDTLDDLSIDCGRIINGGLHHNVIYFPLLRRWFNLLIQTVNPVDISIEDFSMEIFDPLFDPNTHQPQKEPFPEHLSKSDLGMYEFCRRAIISQYAQTLHHTRTFDFIANNPPLNQQSSYEFIMRFNRCPELEGIIY